LPCSTNIIWLHQHSPIVWPVHVASCGAVFAISAVFRQKLAWLYARTHTLGRTERTIVSTRCDRNQLYLVAASWLDAG
jgi:hypothetical protein